MYLVLHDWFRSDKADSHRLIFLRAASVSASHCRLTHRPTERNLIYVSLKYIKGVKSSLCFLQAFTNNSGRWVGEGRDIAGVVCGSVHALVFVILVI